jgi:hypothetical protein
MCGEYGLSTGWFRAEAVIRELRAGGVDVTALHSHMLDEQPRFFFMHFWANDDALKLARTLSAALDRTNRRRQGEA